MNDSLESLDEIDGLELAATDRSLEDAPRESGVEALDAPIGYVVYPVVKTVPATFTYVGKVQPLPIPELDFDD